MHGASIFDLDSRSDSASVKKGRRRSSHSGFILLAQITHEIVDRESRNRRDTPKAIETTGGIDGSRVASLAIVDIRDDIASPKLKSLAVGSLSQQPPDFARLFSVQRAS
jgi:hypothetical protein